MGGDKDEVIVVGADKVRKLRKREGKKKIRKRGFVRSVFYRLLYPNEGAVEALSSRDNNERAELSVPL